MQTSTDQFVVEVEAVTMPIIFYQGLEQKLATSQAREKMMFGFVKPAFGKKWLK